MKNLRAYFKNIEIEPIWIPYSGQYYGLDIETCGLTDAHYYARMAELTETIRRKGEMVKTIKRPDFKVKERDRKELMKQLVSAQIDSFKAGILESIDEDYDWDWNNPVPPNRRDSDSATVRTIYSWLRDTFEEHMYEGQSWEQQIKDMEQQLAELEEASHLSEVTGIGREEILDILNFFMKQGCETVSEACKAVPRDLQSTYERV